MNIASGALKRLAYVVLACAWWYTALRADAAMAEAAYVAPAQALLERAVAHYKEVEEFRACRFRAQGQIRRRRAVRLRDFDQGCETPASGGPSSAWSGATSRTLRTRRGSPSSGKCWTRRRRAAPALVVFVLPNPIDNKMGASSRIFRRSMIQSSRSGTTSLGLPLRRPRPCSRGRCRRWRTIRPRPSMKSTSCTVPFRRTICTSLSST